MKMQPSVSLSMVEGEFIAAVEAAQIMLFAMCVMEDISLHVNKLMILQVDCKGALDLMYGRNISGLMKPVLVQVCFLQELKEANQILCMWIPTKLKMVDMYTKNVSPYLYEHHHCMIVQDDEDDDAECCKYFYEILDTFGMMITNSPGKGVASGQADPTVGVGSQVQPIPIEDCGSESGESRGFVGGRQVQLNNIIIFDVYQLRMSSIE